MSTRSIEIRSNVVQGLMQYAAPGEEPLFCYAEEPPPGQRDGNVEFVEYSVAIRDARKRSRPFRLDVEGATPWRHQSAVRDFYDDDELRRVGYAEAADIVRLASGARSVVVFDHNVRRAGDITDARNGAAKKPVFHVHTDFTGESGRVRAAAVIDQSLTAGCRIAEFNVWRPIAGPVRDHHLALCDASSVGANDLVPAALLYTDRRGEIFYVKFNAMHRWWYLSGMQSDEVWVFKNYDSATDGRARFTPHTAFIDRVSSGAARESVEFRAFAIFDAWTSDPKRALAPSHPASTAPTHSGSA
jgi:hypothetical protein